MLVAKQYEFLLNLSLKENGVERGEIAHDCQKFFLLPHRFQM